MKKQIVLIVLFLLFLVPYSTEASNDKYIKVNDFYSYDNIIYEARDGEDGYNIYEGEYLLLLEKNWRLFDEYYNFQPSLWYNKKCIKTFSVPPNYVYSFDGNGIEIHKIYSTNLNKNIYITKTSHTDTVC